MQPEANGHWPLTRYPPGTSWATPRGLSAPQKTGLGVSASRSSAASGGSQASPRPTVSRPIISAQPVAPSASEIASMTPIVVAGSASSPP